MTARILSMDAWRRRKTPPTLADIEAYAAWGSPDPRERKIRERELEQMTMARLDALFEERERRDES